MIGLFMDCGSQPKVVVPRLSRVLSGSFLYSIEELTPGSGGFGSRGCVELACGMECGEHIKLNSRYSQSGQV
jgi:hypothetical protein